MADTSLEKMAALKPAFKKDGGTVTAGNASGLNDAAAAVVMMSRDKANELGLKPMGRILSWANGGLDPAYMGLGPIPAIQKALKKAGLTMDQIDVTEINEAFASVVLAWEKEHHPDMSKVNPNGGAIALGHPLGCSGAKLMATLLNELERTGGRYGLQTMCEGGGMANATIIERL
jgi:acetyl-CoA acyltransferase